MFLRSSQSYCVAEEYREALSRVDMVGVTLEGLVVVGCKGSNANVQCAAKTSRMRESDNGSNSDVQVCTAKITTNSYVEGC